MKLLGGFVAFALCAFLGLQLSVHRYQGTSVETLEVILFFVLLSFSAILILFGFLDVIGAATKLIDAAMKKRYTCSRLKTRQNAKR